MSERSSVERALADAGLAAGVGGMRDLSGGCIHRVLEIALDDGRTVVAKVASAGRRALLDEEDAGLRALAATGTLVVPRPLAIGTYGDRSVLLMTAVIGAAPSEAGWRRLGRALAALHDVDAGPRYGFPADNHLGLTPQPNRWSDDWVEFNAEHRLGWQVRLARDAGRLPEDAARRLDVVIARLDRHLPRRPPPALLHGDLWSGNALPTRDDDGRPAVAVIDPACSVGDGWADVAMMKLFGGFPEACYDAYAEARGEPGPPPAVHLAVYQLYHLLNHLNLFGRGYLGAVMEVVDRLER